MKKKKFSVVDLFCGIGGFELGFLKENCKVLLAVDNDNWCEITHNKNLPNIPFVNIDIRKFTNRQIDSYIKEDVDILLGGPPCQGFSTIGNTASSDKKKRETHDPRNDLFKEYIRILKHLSPQFFLMENVKGLLTKHGGKIFSHIQEEFIKTGYTFKFVVLDAVEFGVPQFRQRVFFYGNKLGINMTPPMPTHAAKADLLHCEYEHVWPYIEDLMENDDIENNVPLRHGEINIKRYSLIPEGGRLPENKLTEDIYRKNFGNTFKRLDRGKPSLTMVPGHNAFPIHPILNRSLTVREAARIQTFPDSFIFYGPRHVQCMQVGNAVPVKLANAWAKHILSYLRKNGNE